MIKLQIFFQVVLLLTLFMVVLPFIFGIVKFSYFSIVSPEFCIILRKAFSTLTLLNFSHVSSSIFVVLFLGLY